MKAGRDRGNDDEVGTYNFTAFQIFYWTVGKVWKFTTFRKALLCSLMYGARFEKISPHFAQHSMTFTLQICFLRLCNNKEIQNWSQ